MNPKSNIIREMFNLKELKLIWSNPHSRIAASESLFMIYIADQWLEHND